MNGAVVDEFGTRVFKAFFYIGTLDTNIKIGEHVVTRRTAKQTVSANNQNIVTNGNSEVERFMLSFCLHARSTAVGIV